MDPIGAIMKPKKAKVVYQGKSKRSSGFKGTTNDWDSEIKGRGLSAKDEALIASMPRVETKTAQNQEILAELKEKNNSIEQAHYLPDQDLMKRNEEQRKGRVLHHLTLLKKLRKAGIKAWYNTQPYEGIIGLRAIRKGHEQEGLKFVCGVKLGYTTEYDIFHYDAHGTELNKRFIGWRSVIIQLIAKGILTEHQAHNIFGHPQLNDASLIYRRSLYGIRNS